ncbi:MULTISPECIES: hypothetical protein [unclassified Pseudoalteromonas]|uniref:hypothetical protein n=1 Tax=unclassified Pseudoalteromonas TaxID=194690 RepID=UPI001602837B|nr:MULTISPECIES: hypothetical protein [unclassified Pseudoalteromonas]MBB1410237.1 hypothetical protein [Pseudoalteromonas sp. SG44-17]MBB1471096.1 hypothetical protein [Pseudoalteromonas sp. SG41-5]
MNSHQKQHCARVSSLNKAIKAKEDNNPGLNSLKQEITELQTRIVHAQGEEREQLIKQKEFMEKELTAKYQP